MTITEALAEIKTIDKRVSKKLDFIAEHVGRFEQIKDALENEGGAAEVIARERQSISDLIQRIVDIRTAIQRVNLSTDLTVKDRTQKIAEWLVWRREAAPLVKRTVDLISANIKHARDEAKKRGTNVVSGVAAVATTGTAAPYDVVLNVNEVELAKEREGLEEILGILDGQLSLKNATTQIDV